MTDEIPVRPESEPTQIAPPPPPSSGDLVPVSVCTPEPHAGGRQRVEIDPEQFEKLVSMGHTLEELGEFFSCNKRTILRRMKDPEDRALREAWERGRSHVKMSLRRLQMKYANRDGVNGSAAVHMLIHLSKHQLGEHEKQEHHNTNVQQNPDGSPAGPSYVVVLPHNGRDPLPKPVDAKTPDEDDDDEIIV